MILKPGKIVAGFMLMTGAAQAQEGTSGTPQSPLGTAIRDLKITSQMAPNGAGRIAVPDSSIVRPGDAGKRAHTNTRVFVPHEQGPLAQPTAPRPKIGPPQPGTFFETPASLACIYKLVTVTPGCNPNVVTTVAHGGSKVIAIVDAFDNPSALADLTLFSAQFGLPAPTSANFQIVFASGTRPDPDTGWALEEALDIEMAHAMAPNAKIILVEAASNSFADLLAAEDMASTLVAAAGGGEVSNSWGGDEFGGETAFDSHFLKPKVVYFASTGDDRDVEWPSVSTNVVAVGGTSTSRWLNGTFLWESAWADAGAGPAHHVLRPSYQNSIIGFAGPWRNVPDISADANPATGVWVACGTGCGGAAGDWYAVGGTSASSPLMAAMVNAAGRFAASTASELATIYANNGTSKFNDVKYGTCGPYNGFATALAWDRCTGVGTPSGLSGL